MVSFKLSVAGSSNLSIVEYFSSLTGCLLSATSNSGGRTLKLRRQSNTFTGGEYPDGQDDFPVSGVSWYIRLL